MSTSSDAILVLEDGTTVRGEAFGAVGETFGEAVFDVIEKTPERLREVEGIGQVRLKRITTGWADQKAIREIMVFLQSHGIGTSRSVRIFKTYGADAVQVTEACVTDRARIEPLFDGADGVLQLRHHRGIVSNGSRGGVRCQ